MFIFEYMQNINFIKLVFFIRLRRQLIIVPFNSCLQVSPSQLIHALQKIIFSTLSGAGDRVFHIGVILVLRSQPHSSGFKYIFINS